ncbi:MAG: GNAT family N-acetyltransferase [Acidimicrobiia bacterium]|nr:GNAT family N-acetyltransferase [Acidimicrobiia bacterium]
MRLTGTWPGQVTLRQGWSRASARPWNDDIPAASLRLERGSSDFVRTAGSHLMELGAEWVGSPPLDRSTAVPWERAGFAPFLSLDLHRKALDGPVPASGIDVTEGGARDLRSLTPIDDDSFEGVWRLGTTGLAEAMVATPRSTLLLASDEKGAVGFAIVGFGNRAGYLQRIAVATSHRGRGLGRGLLRESLQWCLRRGAAYVLLNTRPGNEAATSLYASEGFSMHPSALRVLRMEA